MPAISMFFGIIVTINYNDHLPPHFHARYQGHKAIYTMDGDLLAGSLPKKQASLVTAWALLHGDELAADWELAREHQPTFRIDPLR